MVGINDIWPKLGGVWRWRGASWPGMAGNGAKWRDPGAGSDPRRSRPRARPVGRPVWRWETGIMSMVGLASQSNLHFAISGWKSQCLQQSGPSTKRPPRGPGLDRRRRSLRTWRSERAAHQQPQRHGGAFSRWRRCWAKSRRTPLAACGYAASVRAPEATGSMSEPYRRDIVFRSSCSLSAISGLPIIICRRLHGVQHALPGFLGLIRCPRACQVRILISVLCQATRKRPRHSTSLIIRCFTGDEYFSDQHQCVGRIYTAILQARGITSK